MHGMITKNFFLTDLPQIIENLKSTGVKSSKAHPHPTSIIFITDNCKTK